MSISTPSLDGCSPATLIWANCSEKYKDKTAARDRDHHRLTYPCLMAADILMYDGSYRSPIEAHVELARDLAERFNNRYGETFRILQPLTPKVCARSIPAESDQEDEQPKPIRKGRSILDDPAQARNKIKSAVTDSSSSTMIRKPAGFPTCS
ncbi:MAG: hypothetical protein ACLVJX_06715 [Merdibacter sp.]